MKILLDTHVILWALTGSNQLPEHEKELILNPENIVFISPVSIWEIAIKHMKAPELIPYDAKEVNDYCLQAGFMPLPVESNAAVETSRLVVKEGHSAHSDPFDRMLMAQAKVNGIKLMTHDSAMKHYDEPCTLAF